MYLYSNNSFSQAEDFNWFSFSCEPKRASPLGLLIKFFQSNDVIYSALAWTWHQGGAASTVLSDPVVLCLLFGSDSSLSGLTAFQLPSSSCHLYRLPLLDTLFIKKWVWPSRRCSPGCSARSRWGYWWVSVVARLTSSELTGPVPGADSKRVLRQDCCFRPGDFILLFD